MATCKGGLFAGPKECIQHRLLYTHSRHSLPQSQASQPKATGLVFTHLYKQKAVGFFLFQDAFRHLNTKCQEKRTVQTYTHTHTFVCKAASNFYTVAQTGFVKEKVLPGTRVRKQACPKTTRHQSDTWKEQTANGRRLLTAQAKHRKETGTLCRQNQQPTHWHRWLGSFYTKTYTYSTLRCYTVVMATGRLHHTLTKTRFFTQLRNYRALLASEKGQVSNKQGSQSKGGISP